MAAPPASAPGAAIPAPASAVTVPLRPAVRAALHALWWNRAALEELSEARFRRPGLLTLQLLEVRDPLVDAVLAVLRVLLLLEEVAVLAAEVAVVGDVDRDEAVVRKAEREEAEPSTDERRKRRSHGERGRLNRGSASGALVEDIALGLMTSLS